MKLWTRHPLSHKLKQLKLISEILKMALKIEMLRCFATVAHSGTLTGAAQQLGRTPSAVSMTLKQLEDHLGEPLFETGRKNKLTALGAFVLEQADRELQQFDTTVRAIEGFASARTGRVRVAAVPSVAGSILPQAISSFIARFPGVQIEVWDMESRAIIREVSRDRVDIGIATAGLPDSDAMPALDPPTHTGLHCSNLMSDAFGLICPDGHPLAAPGGPVSWRDIAEQSLIANPLSAGIRTKVAQSLHREALLQGHNVTSLLAMVRAGLGITILPEMTMLLLGSSGLVFRPLADPEARRHIHLLRKADAPLLPVARELERQIQLTAAPFQT
jgi:DNA-binding transcriptional LysR family regulator